MLSPAWELAQFARLGIIWNVVPWSKIIVVQVYEHIYFHDMAMNLTWWGFFDFFEKINCLKSVLSAII